jgi:hypothetical protein
MVRKDTFQSVILNVVKNLLPIMGLPSYLGRAIRFNPSPDSSGSGIYATIPKPEKNQSKKYG